MQKRPNSELNPVNGLRDECRKALDDSIEQGKVTTRFLGLHGIPDAQLDTEGLTIRRFGDNLSVSCSQPVVDCSLTAGLGKPATLTRRFDYGMPDNPTSNARLSDVISLADGSPLEITELPREEHWKAAEAMINLI